MPEPPNRGRPVAAPERPVPRRRHDVGTFIVQYWYVHFVFYFLALFLIGVGAARLGAVGQEAAWVAIIGAALVYFPLAWTWWLSAGRRRTSGQARRQ